MNKVVKGIWDSVFLIFTKRGNNLMTIIRGIDCKGLFIEPCIDHMYNLTVNSLLSNHHWCMTKVVVDGNWSSTRKIKNVSSNRTD